MIGFECMFFHVSVLQYVNEFIFVIIVVITVRIKQLLIVSNWTCTINNKHNLQDIFITHKISTNECYILLGTKVLHGEVSHVNEKILSSIIVGGSLRQYIAIS